MNRIRIVILGASTAIAMGMLAPAAFADQGPGGGSGHDGGSQQTITTSSSGNTGSSNRKSDDHDGDDGDHPITSTTSTTLGASSNTGIPVVRGDNDSKDHDNHVKGDLLRAPLSASIVSDPAIFAVTPGAVAWTLDSGNVRLGANGRLDVEVHGLVVSSTNSNPLPDIAASVYCNGVVAATTAPVTFSAKGNAQIESTVTLPTSCMVPAVLLHPATGSLTTNVVLATYIAFDGMG